MSGKQTKEHHQLGTDGFFFSNGLAPCTFRHVGWYNASRLVLCSNVEDVAVNGKLEKNMTDKIHFKFHLGKTGGKNLNQQKTWFPKANSGNNHKKRPLQTQKGPPHSGLPQWPFTWSSTDSLLTCHQAHTSTRTSRAQAQKMIHASTSHGQHNSPGTPSATSHGVLSASPGRKTHGAAIVWADGLCYAEYTVLHHDTILQEKINNPFVKCLFGAKRTTFNILKCSRKTLQKHAPLRVKSFNVRIA